MKEKNIHLVNSINEIIKQKNLISAGQTILLTISGGQDSVCLLFIFLQLKTQWNLSVSLLYCQHLWQLDSFYNISLLAKLAYLFKFPFYSSVTFKKIDTEQKARNWRYKIFQKISHNYNYTIITTGHTATDRIETLFFQFIRGTSPKGVFSLKWTTGIFKEKQKTFFPKFSLILKECFFDCFLFVQLSENSSWSTTFFGHILLKYYLPDFSFIQSFSDNPSIIKSLKNLYFFQQNITGQKNLKTPVFFTILVKKTKSEKNKIQKNFYINNLNYSLNEHFSDINSHKLCKSTKIFTTKKNNSLNFFRKKILLVFSPQLALLKDSTIEATLLFNQPVKKDTFPFDKLSEARDFCLSIVDLRIVTHVNNFIQITKFNASNKFCFVTFKWLVQNSFILVSDFIFYNSTKLSGKKIFLFFSLTLQKNNLNCDSNAPTELIKIYKKPYVFVQHSSILRISLKYLFVLKLKSNYYNCFLPWLIWFSLLLKKKYLTKKQHLLFIGFTRNKYRWKNEIQILVSKSLTIKKIIPALFFRKFILFTHYSIFSFLPLLKLAYQEYSYFLVSQASILSLHIVESKTRKKRICYLKNYTIRNFSSSLEIKQNKKCFTKKEKISLSYDSKQFFDQEKIFFQMRNDFISKDAEIIISQKKELKNKKLSSSTSIREFLILKNYLKKSFICQKYSSKNYISFWFSPNNFPEITIVKKSNPNFLIKKYRKIAKKFLTIPYWKKFKQNFSICECSSIFHGSSQDGTTKNQTKFCTILNSTMMNNSTINTFAATKFLVPLFFPITTTFFMIESSQNESLLIRPILLLNRLDLKKLCEYWKVPIYPDKSNQKVKYYRNRIRKQLLPTLRFFFNPQIDTIMFQFTEIANAENFYLDFITNRLLKETKLFMVPSEMLEHGQIKKNKSIQFNIYLFQVFPLAIQRRILKTILEKFRTKKIKFFRIEKILKFIQQKKLETSSLLKIKNFPILTKSSFITKKTTNFSFVNSLDSQLLISNDFYSGLNSHKSYSKSSLIGREFDSSPMLVNSFFFSWTNFFTNSSQILDSKTNILSLKSYKDKNNFNQNNFLYKKFYTQPQCFFVPNLGIFFISNKQLFFFEYF